MKKKVLTEQIITALAEGAIKVEEVENPVVAEAAAADIAAEVAGVEVPAAEGDTSVEAAAAEGEAAAEVTQDVEAEAVTEAKADAGIVAYLQAQVADKDKALLVANIELSKIRQDHADFSAVIGGLVEVVARSMNNMSVALDAGKFDATGMAPVALLAEHKRLSEQFQSKFKAGGVGAVDAADVSAEPVKVDTLHRLRLASVRSTVKAK